MAVDIFEILIRRVEHRDLMIEGQLLELLGESVERHKDLQMRVV